MIMALIDFEVAPEARADLLQAVRPLLLESRALEGNRGYRASTSAESRAHIGVMHEWDTLGHFRAYATSDAFARLSNLLRPMMTTSPISRRLRVDSIEEVRG